MRDEQVTTATTKNTQRAYSESAGAPDIYTPVAIHDGRVILDRDEMHVARAHSEREARAIKRALNSHADLLAALRDCTDRLETCALFGGSAKYAVDELIKPFRAAIAQAEAV
jgi:hypothetical protein